MKLRRRNVLLVLSVILCSGVVFYFLYGNITDRQEEIYQITYIYRSSQLDESQQSIKQGISKASADYKFEIKEVTFDTYITVQEQEEIIKKEAGLGTDAILIEPLDDETIYQLLAEIDKEIPVVLVNGDVSDEWSDVFTCVNTDYYNMGCDLGSYISQDEEIERVYLLQDTTQFKDKNEMYKGVYDELDNHAIEVYILEINDEYTIENAVDDFALGKYLTDAIVVFKGDDLELVGEIKIEKNALKDINLFGFEKSNIIITYLENDYIDCIGVPNEYSIGYQSALSALAELNGEKSYDIEVEYEIIDKETIYTIDNQRLLFPFMQ